MRFIFLVAALFSFQARAQVPDSTYTQCAIENGTCKVSTPGTILYGAAAHFLSKHVTADTPCTNAVFSDPIYGTAKACWFLIDPPPPPFLIGQVPIVYAPQTVVPVVAPAGAAQTVWTAAQALGCIGPAVGRTWRDDVNHLQIWTGSCQKRGYVFSFSQVEPIPANGQIQLQQPVGFPLEQ